MWYAITGTDNDDSLARRQSVRPAHLERLQRLVDEGRLLLAGPFPRIDAEDPGPAGFAGSLIIAEFDDLDAARRWADADPVHRRGRLPRSARAAVPQGPAVSERVETIRRRLTAALAPIALDIEDESHRHAGHAGARDGRGHFRVRIVSAAFEGQSAIARHRAVYAALGDLMQTDIHALAIEARTPEENP